MMRKKVLVIDDEKSIRDIIGEYPYPQTGKCWATTSPSTAM